MLNIKIESCALSHGYQLKTKLFNIATLKSGLEQCMFPKQASFNWFDKKVASDFLLSNKPEIDLEN